MRIISQEEFEEKYNKHQLWIKNKFDGERADFSNVDFLKVKFIYPINLSKAIFQNANLAKVNFQKAELSWANLKNANLENANFQCSVFQGANLQNTNLRGASLREANFQGVNFSGADLRGANLRGTDLQQTDFHHADLRLVNFRAANLLEASFREADLREADFREVDLQGVDFQEADLRGASFSITSLQEVDFWKSNISGAKFKNINFDEAYIPRTSYKDLLGNSKNTIVQQHERAISEYQKKIKKLEAERIALISSTETKATELTANQAKINELNLLLKEREKKSREELERLENQIKEKGIEGITNAFSSLIKSGKGLENERTILIRMFNGYSIAIIAVVALLIGVWCRFYDKVNTFVPSDLKPKMELIDIWVNIAPSFLLIGLLIFFIYQLHKCQRQTVILQKVLYKPKQIEGILKAYFYMSGNNELVNNKIHKVLDDYVDHIINHDIDTNKEESLLKESDSKEANTNEKMLEIIAEITKKI